jgi:hypothetical protein
MRAVHTIAFTGHRALRPGAAHAIRATVRYLAGLYPEATWLTGGAIGADHVAAGAVLSLQLRLELVLPFTPPVMSARWSFPQQTMLLGHALVAAEVHVVSQHYDVAAYRERNLWLVQRADMLVACWDGAYASGTGSTVRMALARGVPVYRVRMG